MKRFLMLFLTSILLVNIVACGNESMETGDSSGNLNVDSQQLKAEENNTISIEKKEEETMIDIKIIVGEQTYLAKLYDNETTQKLIEKLPMTLDMSEMNGNEKYYYFSDNFPTNAQVPDAIHAGDLMLYGSNCLVLFYKNFSTSYSYTPLGYMKDPMGLEEMLGAGNVQIIFEVNELG